MGPKLSCELIMDITHPAMTTWFRVQHVMVHARFLILMLILDHHDDDEDDGICFVSSFGLEKIQIMTINFWN